MHDRNSAGAQMPQDRPAAGHGKQGSTDIRGFDRRPLDPGVLESRAHRGEPEFDIGRRAEELIAMQPDADDIDGTKVFERPCHSQALANRRSCFALPSTSRTSMSAAATASPGRNGLSSSIKSVRTIGPSASLIDPTVNGAERFLPACRCTRADAISSPRPDRARGFTSERPQRSQPKCLHREKYVAACTGTSEEGGMGRVRGSAFSRIERRLQELTRHAALFRPRSSANHSICLLTSK